MRNRRSFNRSQNRDLDRKPAEQIVNEFIKALNTPLKETTTSSSSSSPTNSNENAIASKVESLKSFLNRLKVNFSLSKTKPYTNLITNEEKLKFECELEKNVCALALGLITCLIQPQSSLIRMLALKIILYLSHLVKYHEQFQLLNVNIYVVRIIDLDLSSDETSLCIEYIRLLSQLYPNCLNETHFYCLMSSIEDSNYKLNNLLVETLLEITCKKPKMACKCQVFSELINYVVNVCNDNEFCVEIIIQCLLKVLDDPECRRMIRFDDLFSNLIAPFVDFDYVPFFYDTEYATHKNNPNENYTFVSQKQSNFIMNSVSDKGDSNEPRFESIISACSTALITIFKSYVGIMCFCTNNSQLLRNLLSPLSWFLNSNKRDLDKSLHQTGIPSPTESLQLPAAMSKKLNKTQQMIIRQMAILNHLIDFLYKVFKIDDINTKSLIERTRVASETKQPLGNYLSGASTDLIDDDFINLECDSLFESIETISTQTNIYDLISDKSKTISSSPNMVMCFKAFLIKSFIEAGLFESLLDLYFGLPVSFMQNNCTCSIKFNLGLNNLYASYQNLSLKCLNLFAELFYLAINLLNNEFCIDEMRPVSNLNSLTNFHNQGIYGEMKRLSLVNYLNKLNDFEREKEVIIYLTEFNMKQESIKNGSILPTDLLAKLSFYSQQFLANSGYLCSNRYEIESEILNLSNTRRFMQHTMNDSNPFFNLVASIVDEASKERRKYSSDIEKKLEEQIDSTLILQIESNISSYDPKISTQITLTNTKQETGSNQWNWYEIIKLFENFLMVSSSMHPRFAPTQDALFLEANKKLINDNQKFNKTIKKLLEFYLAIYTNESTTSSSSRPTSHLFVNNHSNSICSTYSLSLNTVNNIQTNYISCVGCYLIDFLLNQFNMKNLSEKNLNRSDWNRYFSQYEYLLIQFIQNIKLFLSSEFFPYASNATNTTGPSSSSASFKRNMSTISLTNNRYITKDSLLSYYILFLGHLTSSEKGDILMDAFKLYEIITKIIETSKDLTVMKLIVSTFNYYTSIKSRSILEKCLCLSYSSIPSKEIKYAYAEFKVYALKLIFNMFRANNLKFEVFFIEIILNSILSNEELYRNEKEAAEMNNNNADPFDTSDQFVFELSINLIEYFLNLRPDFVDSLIQLNILNIDKIESLKVLLIDSHKLKYTIKNYTLIRTKLKFLVNRFLLSKETIENLRKEQIENLVNEWDKQKMDVKYFQLIERNIFDANAINPYFMDEFDDRYDNESDYTTTTTTVTNPTIDENQKQQSASNSESVKTKFNSSDRCVKLYRRINDPNKNNNIYSAFKAQAYLPFHLNSALIRFKKFIENNYYLNERFERKIVKQIQLIIKNAIENNRKYDDETANHHHDDDKDDVQDESKKKSNKNKKLKSLKAALWSICSLCNCDNGLMYISKLNQKYKLFSNIFEFILCIIRITEDYPVLSVRSTGYYCLNFISKTSTGANLIGKVGWHTFQPNRTIKTKAFYSIPSSFSNERQDLSVCSAIDTAVILYNLYRSKSKYQLKQIRKYFYCELSNCEKEYLNEQNKINIFANDDKSLIKLEDNLVRIGFFHENITVPMRVTLMSATASEFNLKVNIEYIEMSDLTNKCNLNSNKCLVCYLRSKKNGNDGGGDFVSSLDETQSSNVDPIRLQIANTISQLTPIANLDKMKANLLKLRQFNLDKFDLCMHSLIAKKILSCSKIKYHFRKFIQELFIEMPLDVLYQSS